MKSPNIVLATLWAAAVPIAIAVDPCFETDSQWGMIGNCIPATACRANVTIPSACPSFPADYVCCFDGNFPGREMRGVWISTLDNIDWPISPSDGPAKQQNDLHHLIDSLEAAGINALYFQVRPVGDALFISDLEPWSRYLTGTQGVPPNPVWDPLQHIINYAGAKGIEVHAWMNPYMANTVGSFDGLDPSHIAMKLPQYAYTYGASLWMDPGAAAVQNHIYDVVIDLATRYDLDGIDIDGYFYPFPAQGVDFPDAATYAEYVESGGNLSVADWRRDNVNRLVERLNIGIHEVKPWMKFSISPFGIYRPCLQQGMPCSIVGFDQYEGLYADPKLWLQEGWIDILQPKLYWLIDPMEQSYPVLLDWWVSQNILNRHVFAGNYLNRIFDGWPLVELWNQVIISRKDSNRIRGSWGNAFLSAKVFGENTEGAVNFFKYTVYRYPALTPTYPWLAQKAGVHSLPGELAYEIEETEGGVIVQWETSNMGFEKNVAVYKYENGSWQLGHIVAFKSGKVNLDSGIYAVASVDRFGQESKKKIISI